MTHSRQAMVGPVLSSLAVAEKNRREQENRKSYTENQEKVHHRLNIITFYN